VDPAHVTLNFGQTAARSIMVLRQVLTQHPATEGWFMPGNVVAGTPWRWLGVSINKFQ
jgi:hypothetical protein